MSDRNLSGSDGEGARGGIYANRSFTRSDDGGWELYGEFEAPDAPWKVRGYISISRDEDDPSQTVLLLFAEAETGDR